MRSSTSAVSGRKTRRSGLKTCARLAGTPVRQRRFTKSTCRRILMYDADYDSYLEEMKEEGRAAGFTVKDSGKKARYDDGMQRDDPTGKPKFSLMWPKGVPYEEQLIYRVAM